MPTYCYRTDDGAVHELTMTISEREAREQDWGIVLEDGRTAKRDLASEHMHVRQNTAGWPMKCDAAGVHPSQVEAAYNESVRLGAPTRFDANTGQAIFEDRSQRRKYLRAKGYHDRDGGYGDG